MNTVIRIISSAALVAGSLTFVSTATAAQEAAGKTTDMTSFLCKDIMRLSGEERAITLGVLHGYYLGKKGVVRYEAAELGKASDDFVEYCLDHPGEPALKAFGRFVK